MAKQKIDEIERKKKELEAELERIQKELDNSLVRVKTDVSTSLDPSEFIRRHPLPVVGAGLIAGFLLGKRGDSRSPRSSGDDSSSGVHFRTLLFGELKKLATKKALSILSGYLEELLNDSSDHKESRKNGAPQ